MIALILLLVVQEDLATNREVLSEIISSPGKSVDVDPNTDKSSGWITHRAVIQEILPGDQCRIEVTEVLEFNSDKSPKRTQAVRQSDSRSTENRPARTGTVSRTSSKALGKTRSGGWEWVVVPTAWMR